MNLKFLKRKAVRVSIASTTQPCQEVISESHNRGVGEKVPDPLTERDLLPRCRSRPQRTTADNATTRPSNGARSLAIYNKAAPQPTTADNGRQQPTTQPPDPLTERDLLQFAIRRRRSRPQPTTADNPTTRPSNGARSIAICNKTAPQPTTADNSRQRHHQTLSRSEIYCNLQ